MKTTILSSAVVLGLALSLSSTAHASIADQINAMGCSSYKPEGREYKTSLLNAAPGQYGPVSFPTNKETIFRGAYESNPQFTLDTTLHGLLGERSWMVGSPMFFGVHQILTGRWTPESDFFPSGGLPYKMYKYLSARGILNDVNTLLKCRAPKFYSDEEANLLSADLMNKVFFNVGGGDAVTTRYFNISDPNYYAKEPNNLGFANNAVDFIIGAVYDQVASIYGIKTLVYRDKRDRGFDLGWWNKVNGGKFWTDWVDNGEIDIPGYITSDELVGYQQRTVDRVRAGWGQGVINNGIDFAYYKMNVDGKTVVAVIDGADDACMVEGRDGRYYSCERDWANITSEPVAIPHPHSDKESAVKALVGVIEVCPGGVCATTSSLFKTYGKYSTRALPAAVVASIQKMKINGQPVKLLLAKDTSEAKAKFSGIKVLVATFAPLADAAKSVGNATSKAAAFADGKDFVTYKVSGKFLGTPKDGQDRVFAIDWICGSDPKTVKHLSEPAPAEGKILKISCE